MSKLVQKVEWEIPGSPKTEMYMYGEADVSQNMAMQEPLWKLYQYENGLDNEIDEKLEKANENIKNLIQEVISYRKDIGIGYCVKNGKCDTDLSCASCKNEFYANLEREMEDQYLVK